MNKNYNIIQINSLTGLLIVLLLISGFVCGFILLPVWTVKNIWNMFIAEMLRGPYIEYYQAGLLWTAIAIGLYMTNRNSIQIKAVKADENSINKENIEELLKEADSDK